METPGACTKLRDPSATSGAKGSQVKLATSEQEENSAALSGGAYGASSES